MNKPILVYHNPDCYSDTDVTVLRHLTNDFNVVWFYEYHSLLSDRMRFNPIIAKQYADEFDITLEIIDSKMRQRNPRNFIYYRSVAKRINSYNPDIVYSCDYFFWTLCRSLLKTNNKVYGIHDAERHSSGLSIIASLIEKSAYRCIRKMDFFFTFSSNQHDLFLKKFGKESYMVGMSYKDFGVSQQLLPSISEGVNLLFFGTISKYKGLDLLIEAIESLNDEGVTNLKVTIAGQGEYWNFCKSLIKSRDIYNLQIRFIENKEIPDLMCSHHFIVLPYRDATQSGPLVTALGYSLPVIAPDFGCFKEILNKESAIIYPQGNLKQALRRVSEITQDDYDIFKNKMNSLRDNYSEDRIANNYIHSFYSVINGAM